MADPLPPVPTPAADVPPNARAAPGRRRRIVAAALLAATVALAVVAMLRYRQFESVAEPNVTATTLDAAERQPREKAVVGTYATGTAPGDRVIVVHPGGKVEFSEIGAEPAIVRTTDTFELMRCGEEFCLVTAGSGRIDIIDIDTLVYFRDRYRRTR